MASERKKPRINKNRMIAFFVAIFLMVVLVRTGADIYVLKKQQAEAVSQRTVLEEQVAELKEQVENMNTPEYVEQQARDLLHMIMPGEILYIPKEHVASAGGLTTTGSAFDALKSKFKPSDGI